MSMPKTVEPRDGGFIQIDNLTISNIVTVYAKDNYNDQTFLKLTHAEASSLRDALEEALKKP